ncbi:hypothetical protein UJ101_01533 [Flavobacteriaceae bacterium UJ101]|nr:hypothetical protein UJ101_01533 [Flavobacteriaceae bacterium UJ101]
MNKSLILNQIKKHYNFKSDTQFAAHLGIKPQVLSNWKSRNTYDAELIYTKCVDLNPAWILTGEGNMLKENEVNYESVLVYLRDHWKELMSDDRFNAFMDIVLSEREIIKQKEDLFNVIDDFKKKALKKPSN